jgi:hypothetical protein
MYVDKRVTSSTSRIINPTDLSHPEFATTPAYGGLVLTLVASCSNFLAFSSITEEWQVF